MFNAMKKGAADLIAIIIAIVVVGVLAYVVMNYFSSTAKSAAEDGVNQVANGLQAAVDGVETVKSATKFS